MSETKEANGEVVGLDLLALGREVKAAQDDGVCIEILHPATRAPLGVRWYLAGPDSDRYREARNKIRALRKARRDNRQNTPEEDDAEVIRILASATLRVECDEGVTFGGLVPTKEAEYIKVLSLPGLSFMVEQIDREGSDRASFMKT